MEPPAVFFFSGERIMRVQTLINDIAADRDLPATDMIDVNDNDHRVYGTFQVSGITTATVELFGRLDSSMAWYSINTYTVNDAERVTLFPQMYARITGWAAGTIRAQLSS